MDVRRYPPGGAPPRMDTPCVVLALDEDTVSNLHFLADHASVRLQTEVAISEIAADLINRAADAIANTIAYTVPKGGK